MASKPPLASMHWLDADETKLAVSLEVYERCEIIVMEPSEFERHERHLKHVAASIRFTGFDDNFPWHRTGWNKDALLQHGFRYSAAPTILVVRHATWFEVKYLYWPMSTPLRHQDALCKHTFDAAGTLNSKKNLKGRTVVGERGNKGMSGTMVTFGSHDLNGGHYVKKGDPAIPALYNPSGAIDPTLNELVSKHAAELSALETRLTPAYAAHRKAIADQFDPERLHRMDPTVDAFSLAASSNYAVVPHDDSGEGPETVGFTNRNGPLPEGHEWLFCVGGHVHPLPNATNESVLIVLQGKGLYHGTLPTSSTGGSYAHGDHGAALVSKTQMIESLKRQIDRGESTPTAATASALYGVLSPNPSTTPPVATVNDEVATEVNADGIGEGAEGEATAPPSPPEVSSALENAPFGVDGSSPPGSHAGETLGSGGCVAVALSKLIHTWTSVDTARQRLNAKLDPIAATLRPDLRVPEFVGVPNDHWHPEVVKAAVIEERYHFRKLDLSAVDLAEELKVGGYLIDGVLNDSFVKLDRRGNEVRHETDPEDSSSPRNNEAGWRHAIAVVNGRVLEKEFEMSAKWLWLSSMVERGYMYKILKVYRVFKCRGGPGCKGECSHGRAPASKRARVHL